MLVFAVESSCDETSAAVVEDGRRVLSNIVASQINIHALYGGVVPEIASRKHVEAVSYVADSALKQAGVKIADLDAVAVTVGPGLIGALLVGVGFAKGLAYGADKPLVPVHHVRGHIAANYIGTDLEPPFLCLTASGGHTLLTDVRDYTDFHVLGSTRDDAAGEAFDKAARVIGLGYPGGAALDRLAETGDPKAFHLPKAVTRGGEFDFSFSGLKTAVINAVHTFTQRGEAIPAADIAASFREAAVSALVEKAEHALDCTGRPVLALSGGVAANSLLRRRLAELCAKRGIRFYMPELKYCGDNGAMIAAQGCFEYLAGSRAGLTLNASAGLAL